MNTKKIFYPYESLPRLIDLQPLSDFPPPPDDQACFLLWQKYSMLENIQHHSLMVAHIATALAKRAETLGIAISVSCCRAAGLLHDIAKTYCLLYGGSHALLGGAWVAAETKNYAISQGVLLHVHWPWKFPKGSAICCLPIFIIYADKRVRHNECVTLKERFEDILIRYGKTEEARLGIEQTYKQSLRMEELLSEQLGWNLNEYTFDSRRMVT